MKRFAQTSLALFVLLFSILPAAMADEYSYGALREDSIPDWVEISPRLAEETHTELNDFVDNSAGLPPVGNQSSQGSCTAWATAYYTLTYMQAQEYGWDLSDPAHRMSAAFTYNLINGGADSGSYPFDAFKVFEEMGCATEADMPYTASNCTDFPSKSAFQNGMQFRTLQTVSINTGTRAGVDDLRAWIASGGIGATAMTVWPNFDGINGFDTTYCVNDISGEVRGGHAVTAVGYDDNRQTSDGVGAFRMVNSWGTGWGDDGFWWMSYEAFMDDRIGWGYTIYAIDRIGYEPTLLARIEIDHSDRYAISQNVGVGTTVNPLEEFHFMDFRNNRSTFIPYSSNVVLLDLTDMHDEIDADNPNDFFVEISDDEGTNGHDGVMHSFQIIDLTQDFIAVCPDVPVTVPDSHINTNADLVLYYPAVPPTNLNSNIDFTNGEVSLNWEGIAEVDGFASYGVFRDGSQIGTTTGLAFLDTLPDFGVYNYTVRSVWDVCQSWDSNTTQEDWITPVQSSYPGIATIDGSTGEFQLSWEQLRYSELTADNGTSESAFIFNEGVPAGAKIARKVTATADGKLNRIGAYFTESNDSEMGEVRLYILQSGVNDLPTYTRWSSDSFVPAANEWYWVDMDDEKIVLDEGEEVWLAVEWEESGKTPLGRDTDGGHINDVALMPDGVNWIAIPNSGIPMLRGVFGESERVDGYTGLTGFNIYLDDELLGSSHDDAHIFTSNLDEIGEYTFRVDAVYLQGVVTGNDLVYDWDGASASVDESDLPLTWEISQAYPNPFNPSTVVDVFLSKDADLNVRVYNMLGQQVEVLANGRWQKGSHKIAFNATNLASGIYFIQAEVPGIFSKTMKITYLR